MLAVDPLERISAGDALKHPYLEVSYYYVTVSHNQSCIFFSFNFSLQEFFKNIIS